MPEAPGDEQIEVGAVGGDVKYWLIAEACRQSELRLAAQAQNIGSMEARATSILAWSTATMVGLIAAASQGRLIAVAAASGACLLLASIACIIALWPRDWHPPGYDIGDLLKMRRPNELEIREQVALGYETSVRNNDRRVAQFVLCLRAAWLCFVAAPIAGGVAAAFIG